MSPNPDPSEHPGPEPRPDTLPEAARIPGQRPAPPEEHASTPTPTDTAEQPAAGGSGRTVRLDAPGTGVRDTWRAMGPGIVAAMTGIGASHIIHGPTAGAQFGYTLLWVIPFAYLLKYCAFEFAHRYTLVRGESIMEAYQRTGARYGNWPLWYLLVQCLSNTFGIAGRALGAGALIWAALPFLPLPVWGILVLLSSLTLLWAGRYKAVELAVKICLVVFVLAVLIAFVLQAPPPSEYVARLLPTLPPIAGLMLFSAMWGYFPTTLEVSTMQSNWAVDKKAGMVRVRELRRQGYTVEVAPNYLRNHMKLFKRDMNISYVLSLLTGMAFLMVGAVVLHPIGLVPASSEMGLTIARIYTDTFGMWIFPVIIAGGTAALWSTVFTYFDGQARVFEECCVRLRNAWDSERTRKYLYRGFQVLWLVAGSAVIIGMPEPVFMVQLASVLALLFSPVLYWLNIKAVRDNFTAEDAEFMPSALRFAWAWCGLAGITLISLYYVYMQFLAPLLA
ncbi:Divalent metal cation transporter MntH [Nocardiopsis dassonvillei]|uniref:Nramp family divalent metal transporter n=1 Tax=Nocardiopsis dassonvillei TaxID=2014 RepID=UPI003F544D7F